MHRECWPYTRPIACPRCGRRETPVWGEARYAVRYAPRTGRYVQYTCACGQVVRDYQRWHEPLPKEEEEEMPVVVALPQWFWLAMAALALVLLLMAALGRAGY